MSKKTPKPKQSDKDLLTSRPETGQLPTVLDPGSAEARHEAIDPKQVPPGDQGNPDAVDPAPGDITRTA